MTQGTQAPSPESPLQAYRPPTEAGLQAGHLSAIWSQTGAQSAFPIESDMS
jgi:hypothetical protein